MDFEGAVIKEQGVTFAIVIVKMSIIDVRTEAENAIRAFQPVFPGIPVVLMAQDSNGTPTYFGRPDIAKFMSNIPLSSVPWKRYTLH